MVRSRQLSRRDWIIGVAGSAGALACPALARAQGDFPASGATLRYVVPFPAGGLTDVMARLVGQQLGHDWKVPVVIDNKPGGGALIGADAVAKSPGDGNTLLAITMTHSANVTLFPKAPFDLTRDLKPVALLAASPMMVVVPASSPIKDFAQLREVSKQRNLNAGSSGNGSVPHLVLALFNQLNGSQITHIPYKGGAPAMTDLIGGQLDVVFSNFPESLPFVKGGKLRALALASAQRNPHVPDVPTTAELGMPELVAENWTGVMVPASTPAAIVKKLGEGFVKAMAVPEVAARASEQGFRVDARGPDDFAKFLGTEIAKWAKVIESARIQVT